MKSNEQDNKIPAELLGRVRRPAATGGHLPKPDTIKATLAEGATMALFCHGCGFTQGIDQEGLEYILEETKLEIPVDQTEVYIGLDSCNLCGTDLENLRLEKF